MKGVSPNANRKMVMYPCKERITHAFAEANRRNSVIDLTCLACAFYNRTSISSTKLQSERRRTNNTKVAQTENVSNSSSDRKPLYL